MKNLMIIRLIVGLTIFLSIPTQAQAFGFSLDIVGLWLKESIIGRLWEQKTTTPAYDQDLATVADTALISSNLPLVGVTGVYEVMVTGYSSSPEETDDTPFITASGAFVHDGIVAANFLPFGTKVRLPEIFGNKVFVVKDRMAAKHSDKVDIWFESKELAKAFGKKKAQVEILQSI